MYGRVLIKDRNKLSVVRQNASITSKLARTMFPFSGALYLREDVEEDESIGVDVNRRCEVDVHRDPFK